MEISYRQLDKRQAYSSDCSSSSKFDSKFEVHQCVDVKPWVWTGAAGLDFPRDFWCALRV